MPKDSPEVEEITPVIFRKENGGDILAVFPTIPEDVYGNMLCYAHVGQHGICSYLYYLSTKPAKPEEYAALKAELESEPYNYRLKVYRKISPKLRATLQKNLNETLRR